MMIRPYKYLISFLKNAVLAVMVLFCATAYGQQAVQGGGNGRRAIKQSLLSEKEVGSGFSATKFNGLFMRSLDNSTLSVQTVLYERKDDLQREVDQKFQFWFQAPNATQMGSYSGRKIGDVTIVSKPTRGMMKGSCTIFTIYERYLIVAQLTRIGKDAKGFAVQSRLTDEDLRVAEDAIRTTIRNIQHLNRP